MPGPTTLPAPPEPNCLICEKPLGPGEIHLSRTWHFDCEKCLYCGGAVNYDLIEKCLSDGRKPSHPACYKTHLFSQFQNKDLIVRLEHVDLLNEEINSFFPAVDPNHVDIESLYKILQSLKTAAAAVSYALDVTKDKLQIQRSHNYNADTLEKKKEQIRKARTDATEEAEREKRSAMLAEERENPELRMRRKAIEGLMKACNLSLEAATSMIDSQNPKGKIQ